MNENIEKGVILIVDDDKKILRDLRGLFNGIGYDVVTAIGKIEAVGTITAISFDVIILEVSMKGGVEILKYIKISKPKTTVIIYSKCDDKLKKKAEEIGMDEFFPKSAELSLLVDAVQRVCG